MNSYHGFSFQSSGGNFNPFTFENGLILANLSLRGQMSHLLKSLKIISQILDFLDNKCTSKKTKTTIHKESKNGSYLVEALSYVLAIDVCIFDHDNATIVPAPKQNNKQKSKK